eukprot:TRINITY_DN10530_c0_g1_i2.p1 TRINITY_DN10530_c0_g1~~TRINITY_DN10530_c0_g1_i2.p1  ORF type:complete len:460 (+),score=128.93 TRINITY_DN10530_c0_g1_i2:88-1467(+)
MVAGEVLTIHVGQAGCQIGDAFWEQMCAEHGVDRNGDRAADAAIGDAHEDEGFPQFFTEAKGKAKARALFVDTESDVIDRLRVRADHELQTCEARCRNIYLPGNMIAGQESSGGVFFKGDGPNRNLLYGVDHRLQGMLEGCDKIGGVVITCAFGSGTGSGLTAAILDSLEVMLDGMAAAVPIYTVPVLVGHPETETVGNINEILALQSLTSSRLRILATPLYNSGLRQMCTQSLGQKAVTHEDMNRIVAQLMSSVTAPMRFRGPLRPGLDELEAGLVRGKRKLVMANYAPLSTPQTAKTEHMTLSDTMSRLGNDNTSLSTPLSRGERVPQATQEEDDNPIGVAYMYRGNIVPKQVADALALWDTRMANHGRTKYTIGLTYEPPVVPYDSPVGTAPHTACKLENSNRLQHILGTSLHCFDLLWAKQAFIHHFCGAGISSHCLAEARSSLGELIHAYKDNE